MFSALALLSNVIAGPDRYTDWKPVQNSLPVAQACSLGLVPRHLLGKHKDATRPRPGQPRHSEGGSAQSNYLRSVGSTSVVKRSSERNALRGSRPGSWVARISSVIGVESIIFARRSATCAGVPRTALRRIRSASGRIGLSAPSAAAESHFPY